MATIMTPLNALLFLGVALYWLHLERMHVLLHYLLAPICMALSFTASAAWAGLAVLATVEILRVEQVADDGIADGDSSAAGAV